MTLPESISAVRSRIAAACARSGRGQDEVTLIAVTKTVPIDVVRQARDAGIDHFAENYANELAAKSPEVPATWHFIGRLQSGTVPRVADHADVLHSAIPGPALRHTGTRVAGRGGTIRCLAQVDFTGARQGVSPDDLADFLIEAQPMAGIALVGLMTLPPWTEDPQATRPYFARLRELRDGLREAFPYLRELSMGMSGDYEVAVEEGATMVRIGTALFGPRPEKRER